MDLFALVWVEDGFDVLPVIAQLGAGWLDADLLGGVRVTDHAIDRNDHWERPGAADQHRGPRRVPRGAGRDGLRLVRQGNVTNVVNFKLNVVGWTASWVPEYETNYGSLAVRVSES